MILTLQVKSKPKTTTFQLLAVNLILFRDIFESETIHRRRKRKRRLSLAIFAALFLICLAIVLAIPLGYLDIKFHTRESKPCKDPPIRREWRTLTAGEKHNYIQAVHCLESLPSELQGKGNFYDDLVYLHMSIGSQCLFSLIICRRISANMSSAHFSASFLPWHRASLYIFESLLTKKCGLKIPMPYWDWAVDHQSLETSSIWSSSEGFGGDGAVNLPEGFGKGRCVVDGPFANTTRLWWDGQENSHCLGRGFVHADTSEMGKLSGTWFSPESIAEMTRSDGYFEFEKRLENTAHNALHWGIRGDFSSMTSANEPLFWLHHAQLDRLWWQWQEENPGVRMEEYEGVSFNTTEGKKIQGTLNDQLRFTGFWKDIKVREVMKTEGQLLCYRY